MVGLTVCSDVGNGVDSGMDGNGIDFSVDVSSRVGTSGDSAEGALSADGNGDVFPVDV